MKQICFSAKRMLRAIVENSDNESCTATAIRILSASDPDIDSELKYAGGFMSAVINGDFLEAYSRADAGNKAALLTLLL